MDIEDNQIGRRVREIRTWRRMTVTATAGLAGISTAYLSLIERGQRPVTKRAVLEALAQALQVSPADLAGTPFPPRDGVTAEARAAASLVETAVSDVRFGDRVDVTPRPWQEIAADLNRLNSELRPRADYAAQGFLVPGLIKELHATYATDASNRTNALHGLVTCYHAATMIAKNMGIRGVAQLAADRQMTVAERLGTPEWIAHATWVRTQAIGGGGRDRQAALALRGLADFSGETMTSQLIQAMGQLHLSVALAFASMKNEDEAWTHFAEAEALASRQGDSIGRFGYMWFGKTNVRIWKVALGTEFGYGGKVAEFARHTRPEELPSPARQAEFYADLGRALATDRHSRDRAVRLLRRAEDLAPQRIRNMPFVRETVSDLLRHAKRDADGRELRGLAYRMGVAPSG